MMSKGESLPPYQLVPPLIGAVLCKEKWETKENGELPTSKFLVQMGNTPHQLAIPTVNASITKYKKNGPRCHGWLPFNPSR